MGTQKVNIMLTEVLELKCELGEKLEAKLHTSTLCADMGLGLTLKTIITVGT